MVRERLVTEEEGAKGINKTYERGFPVGFKELAAVCPLLCF